MPTSTNITRLPDGFGVYPASDSFDALSSASNTTYLIGNYIRFEPWNSQLNVDGTRFWGSTQVYASSGCDIHNGLARQNATFGGPLLRTKNEGPATVSHQSVVADGSASGFLFRDYSALDVELKGNFRFRERPSVYTGFQGFAFALAARVNGGLAGAGGLSTRQTSVSGYYFGLFGEPSGGTGAGGGSRVRYMIIKVSAGVPTSVDVNTTIPGSTTPNLSVFFPGNLNVDHVLRFTVQDVAGVVRLRGYRTDAVTGLESLVCTYDDSSTPITAAGRAGIVMSGDNSSVTTPSGQRQTSQCNYWSVGPLGGAPVLYEGWRRFNSQGGRSVSVPGITLPSGVIARSLRHGWAGDFSSADATGTQAFESSLQLDSANNRLYAKPAIASVYVHAFSQVIARDPKFQDRVVTVMMESGSPTISRDFGIVLFGATGGNTSDTVWSNVPAGYRAIVQYKGSTGTFDLLLFRMRGNNLPAFQILKKTGLAGLALGTAFDLRFQALTLTIPSPQDGFVSLKVFINGTQQTWDLAAGIYDDNGQTVPANSPSVAFSVSADGSVIDRKTSRVREGYGEGVVFASGNPSTTANSFFDTWTAGVGGVSTDTPEEDQATIAVSAENDGATGTFNYAYEFGHVEELRRPQLRHAFDSDHEYAALQTQRIRRRWKIGNNAATSAEASGLKTFYGLRKGVEVPFNWTSPYGDAVVARFIRDSLVVEQITPSVFRWTVELEEVLPE